MAFEPADRLGVRSAPDDAPKRIPPDTRSLRAHHANGPSSPAYGEEQMAAGCKLPRDGDKSRRLEKPKTTLSAQDRVILFCVATEIGDSHLKDGKLSGGG